MNAANDPHFKRKGPSAASLILVPLALGLATTTGVLKLLWHDAPQIFMPLPDVPFTDHLSHWISGTLALLTNGVIGSGPWHKYVVWLDQLEPASLRWALYVRFIMAAIAGSGTAIIAFLWMLNARQNDKPLRGRSLRKGPSAVQELKREAAAEWKDQPPGIRLHPEVEISHARETKHLLVMGASGSGKTNIIWQVLNEAIRRKDRVVIFDSKGDFTSELKPLCLLAPWDPRSLAWDVARDCVGPLDAQALASRLIPDSDKDPIWPNASRAVLVALIVHLQTSKPGQWTFTDLRKLLHAPVEDLRLIAQQHNPEAMRSLEDGSKTTQSILINLMAFMTPVVDMAQAWSDPKQKRFSMRQWIEGNSKLPRTVVMQGSQRFDRTASALINSLLSVMASTIASPSLPDDKNRRIWLILDEFPQLGKLRDIGPLIRMGRSKGLRIVIGAQDIAELRDIYGTHKADAWSSSFTTSIYARLAGGATADWASRRIGDKETNETNDSKTQSGNGTSESQQTTLRRSPTVLPAEFSTLLGTRSDGVDALIDGFDDAVYLVKYPYHIPKPIHLGALYADWVDPILPDPAQATAQAAAWDPRSGSELHSSDPNLNWQAPNHTSPADPDTAQAAGSVVRPKRWTKRPPSSNGDDGSTP